MTNVDSQRKPAFSIGNVTDYDIFLAHDIDDPEQGGMKRPLYDAIGDLCQRLGHKAAIPYRFVGFEGDPAAVDPRGTFLLINDLLIPQARLVLCYLGINSTSVGVMDGRAKLLKKDIIYFYEAGTRLETIEETERLVTGIQKETRPGMPQLARAFFHRTGPNQSLESYENIRKIVEFTSLDDCLQQLEVAIRNAF